MAELTDNINYLQPTGFKIVMDRKHFPNLTFFATSVLHPSMNLSFSEVPYRRTNIRVPGDKLVFGEVQFNVIMDENMTSFEEMYDWMRACVETSNTSALERSTTQRPTSADITVSTLTSANTKIKEIRYIDAIPTSLGDVSFETIGGDAFITFPVTFAFTYFELV